jgi:GNAT superfamily N-acetyltransferase
MQRLSARVWRRDPTRLNFDTSFGTLAWERGGDGRTRLFERGDDLCGWARLAPGYRRIRRMGEFDDAPPSLVWQVDLDDLDREHVLDSIITWAESRSDQAFTTSHTATDRDAAALLARRGYEPDPTEPFSLYLQQPLADRAEPALEGYSFVTMSDLDDVDARAEVHRRAWEASTFSGDALETVMATWPYRGDLDFVAVAADGTLVASAIVWFDPDFGYGEFEPVGTLPDHRGRGVGRALLEFALTRLHQVGASHALVGARGDDDYPLARRLYRAVGSRSWPAR